MSNPKWKKNLLNPNTPITVDAISDTIESIFDVLYKKGPALINLQNLDINRINPIHLSSILRATSNWEKDVPGWNEALEIAKTSLIEKGFDPNDALYGLIPTDLTSNIRPT